jgi:hypothetical protein
MADRVQAIKWEEPAGGGSELDLVPSELEPNEDGLDARAYHIQNDTSSDSNVKVSRDASDNMTFADGVVSGTKTLTDLLASGGDSNVDGGRADTVYTVQDVDGGNASSF